MKRNIPILLALLAAWPCLAAAKGTVSAKDRTEPALEEDQVAGSVVRIFTFFRKSNTYQPWQFSAEEEAGGAGCILADGRILTNAHVVSGSVFLQVRKAGDPKKYPAKVEFTAHDSELAVLRVEDPAFYRGTTPLSLGSLPRQRDRVLVYGFPVGGDDLSVTEGIVSRIEVTDYAHSGRGLLTVQTDAAINPGNSGGPAVLDGKLIGVAFQYDQDSQSTGYLVPAPVIERFLRDIADGRYDGVPELGIRYQSLENESLRRYRGLDSEETGIQVSTVVHGSSAWGVLQPGDILTRVDGVPIADDGTAPLRGSERVLFAHLISLRQIGEALRLQVIRAGRRLELTAPLRNTPALVGNSFYGDHPTYFVFAGLVFTPLTRDYLGDFREGEAIPSELKYYADYGLPTPERRQVILLSHVLPHQVNLGYQGARDVVVERVNGRPVADMRELVSAFAHPQGGFHIVETDGLASPGELLALDAAQAAKAHPAILADYGIEKDRSADLR